MLTILCNNVLLFIFDRHAFGLGILTVYHTLIDCIELAKIDHFTRDDNWDRDIQRDTLGHRFLAKGLWTTKRRRKSLEQCFSTGVPRRTSVP